MDYKWYIVNATAGSEVQVCAEINKLAQTDSDIKEAFIPTKKAYKILRGKKVETDLKLFPAYVFVNLICNHNTLGKIRSISKVKGFLGPKFKPDPISDSDVHALKQKMLSAAAVEEDIYEIGDTVKIIDGPFEGFVGNVEWLDKDKKILKVSVSIFGRATSVDIDRSKLERV